MGPASVFSPFLTLHWKALSASCLLKAGLAELSAMSAVSGLKPWPPPAALPLLRSPTSTAHSPAAPTAHGAGSERASAADVRLSVALGAEMRQAGRPACASGAPSPPFLPPVRVRPWLPVLCLGLAPAALTHAPFVRARLFLSSSLSLTASYSSTSSLPSGHVVCSLRRPPDTTDVVLPPARWEDMCPAARRAPAHRRTGAPSLPLSLARSRAARERSSGVCLACEALNCRLPGRPAEASDRSIRRRAPVQCARTRASEQRGVLRCSLARQTNPPTYPSTHPHGRVPPRRARVGAWARA